jgi:two-component system response regulator YesN
MIRLMLVDDEAVIRQGLRQAVRWADYGVQVVGEARSGAEALEKARALWPDIVITDVRMSEGDGLSLAKRLPEILPDVRMIMLSGYSDMQYMMEAIKYGVRDYLLKPAGSAEILSSVLKLRDGILLERQKKQQSSRIERLISESMDTLKAMFFEDLLSGKLDGAKAQERARALGVDLPGPRYALILAVPRPDRGWEMLQLISSQLEAFHPAVHTREGGAIAAILNVEQEAVEARLDALQTRLLGLTDPMTPPCMGPCDSLAGLGALREACEAAQARSIWFPSAGFLRAKAAEAFPPLQESALLPLERAIVQGVRSGNFAAFSEGVDSLFQLLERAKPARAQFQETLLGVARSIQVFSEDSGLYDALDAVFKAPYTVEQVKAAVVESMNGVYSQYGPQVRNALTYMSEHSDSDLSLSDVAQVLYISPSYLTRLLKNSTGRGFNDWLHLIRINKAKKLLEQSGLHHYEIAERVGYSSYKIFSEYFLRLVGMSARSYRDNVLHQKVKAK